MFQARDIPNIIESRILHFALSLPSDSKDRQRIIERYSHLKGYEFLNPKSKLYKYFLFRLSQLQTQPMDEEISLQTEGNLQQISVGGLCEIVKQNMSQEILPYTPLDSQALHHKFSSQVDFHLFQKTIKILHDIKLTQIEALKSEEKVQKVSKPEKITQRSQVNKQMGTKQDGSLGIWGGNKYEGLGSRNEFTDFRRQQSQSYYQKTFGNRNKN